MVFNEIDYDIELREVIRNLEKKIISKRIPFKDINPNNTSVKIKIKEIKTIYPKKKDEIVEDLLDTYRSSLKTRSKERNRAIVSLINLFGYVK